MLMRYEKQKQVVHKKIYHNNNVQFLNMIDLYVNVAISDRKTNRIKKYNNNNMLPLSDF